MNARISITRIDGDPDALAASYAETAELMAEVGRDHGLLLHGTARTEDGLVIINVWPSAGGSDAAAGDPRRLAVLAHHGLGPEALRRELIDGAVVRLFADSAGA